MDGDKPCHDLTRLRANGEGSFDTIWKNLSDVMGTDLEFKITLRIHYHNDNLDSIDALIDRLVAAFPGDERLELYFKNVSPLGSANDKNFPFVERERRKAVETRFAERVDGRLPVMGGLAGTGYVCYACRPNSLVIRADGTISKCTVALYDDRNMMGRLLPDGTLDLDQSKLQPWIEILLNGTDEGRACPIKCLPQAETTGIAAK
jgi:uncharacterized protein